MLEPKILAQAIVYLVTIFVVGVTLSGLKRKKR